MSKRKKTFVTIAILMAVVALGLAAGVYAKYIASFSGQGSAKVAKWAFESDNQTSTVTCSLTGTYVSGAVKTENGSVYIAPGTSGKCDITVANTTSEVAVDYTISAKDVNDWTAPKNLQLNGVAAASFADVTGTLAIGESKTVSINWTWPYGNGDETEDGEDTDDGVAAKDMVIKFAISGVQKKPTTN